jgi:FtsH-binding integral membrane protein
MNNENLKSKRYWLKGGFIGLLVAGGASFLLSVMAPIEPTGGMGLLYWFFVQVPILGMMQFFGMKFHETTSGNLMLATVVAGWSAIGFFLGALAGLIFGKIRSCLKNENQNPS